MLCWFLLQISVQPDYHVSAVNLRHFIGCAVREFTFLAKKPGCGGLHITTDACWGRCETWEVSGWEAVPVQCTQERNVNVIVPRGDVNKPDNFTQKK